MYKLKITFQTIKPIPLLKPKIGFFQRLKRFKNVQFSGIFKTYVKKKLFTVLKSPHVNKKSREQFVYKMHKHKLIVSFLTINQLFNFILLLKTFFSKNIELKLKIMTYPNQTIPTKKKLPLESNLSTNIKASKKKPFYKKKKKIVK